MHVLVFTILSMLNLHTKCKFHSFAHSKGMMGTPKFYKAFTLSNDALKMGHMTLTTTICGGMSSQC